MCGEASGIIAVFFLPCSPHMVFFAYIQAEIVSDGNHLSVG